MKLFREIYKMIKNTMRFVKKSDNWTKSVLFLTILLLTIITINKYQEPVGIEAFTQRDKYVLKKGEDIYDDFYCDIYDDLVYDDVKNRYEMDELSRILNLNKSTILDVGCGTGQHAKEFSKLGAKVYGIDKSASMVKKSKMNCPDGKFKQGDVLNSGQYPQNSFNYVNCLYFTIYYMKNKLDFFKNSYKWLKPGGGLILHLVNREKFDPIIAAGDPLVMVSPQKFAKRRITNTVVKFKDFKYKANFKFKRENNLATFEENLKDDASGNIRANKLTLFMETQKHILSLAKSVGFIMKGKIDMIHCMYEYQYIYILYKPK
jgi:SAM-dependent methyltransferase